MEPNSLADETKPWLTADLKPHIQRHKSRDYQVGSSLLNVVYKPTTQENEHVPLLPQVFASVAAASFHIVVGISLAYSAILVPQLEADDSDLPVTKTESSWLASVLVLIVPVGALMAGFVMEYIGRLNTIRFAAVPCALGWILIATGNSVPMLLCGRLLTGISAGLGTSPAIVYITEVGTPEYRGSLISTCPTLASLGMLLVYLKGAFFHWRTAAWFSLLYIAIPLVLVTLWIPESPVWLVARGRIDEAEASLKWLAGKKSSAPQKQLAAMVKSQDMKALVATGFKHRLKSFLKPSGYKPLFILFALFTFQQFSGIYITLFYAVTFFQDVGSGINPSLATILVGVVRFLMSLCNTALMKRFGRRELCMLSGVGMAICMTTSGYFTLQIMNGVEGVTWVPVVCMLLYVCTSMLGLLSIPWTMTAELFPTEIRGLAHGITISVAHIIMFVAVQVYRDLQDLLGGAHVVQWFFAAVALGGSTFVFFFLPETHGKKLAEIEQYFNENTMYISCQAKKERKEDMSGTGVAAGELASIAVSA